MSLEGGRKSDIYDKMLEESNEPIYGRQSVGGNQGGFNYNEQYYPNNSPYEVPQYLNQRKS
jgi:hypothetical protein